MDMMPIVQVTTDATYCGIDRISEYDPHRGDQRKKTKTYQD